MLEHGEAQQGADQEVGGACKRVCAEHGPRQQRGGHQRAGRDGQRKQQIHRSAPRVAVQVGQLRRKPFAVVVSHPEEQVQLGAPAHQPQRRAGGHRDLIVTAVAQRGGADHQRDDGHFMVEAGLQAQPETLPIAGVLGAGRFARARDHAHQVGHFQPGPQRQSLCESQQGADGAAILGAHREIEQAQHSQRAQCEQTQAPHP